MDLEEKEFEKIKFMNKKAIEELFEFYEEDLYVNSKENKQYVDKIMVIREKLYNSLTDEQKTEYEQLVELNGMNEGITSKRIFIFAFRLAVKLIAGALD